MDFIILTVNGVDVSQCSHEEAVQRFLEASEPIMVEVKRRPGKVSQTTEAKVMTMMMMLTMMLLMLMLIMVEVKRRPQGKASQTTEAKVLSEVEEEQESSGRESEEGPLIYPDFEYEEIELKRASPSERLGMTLCYEDEDEEGNTEIFIDDIAPEGLAARDGRLRLGDQIIQINGVKVKTKAKAQEMFLTITGDVSLLVVRPPVLGGGGYEEDLDNLLDLSEEVTTRQRDEERAREVSKNRLSSTSSKDSGHNSGTIDRSTTASSNSASSKTSEESEELLKKRSKCEEEEKNSEFYYVDGKLEQISDFYRELKHRGVSDQHNHITNNIANNMDSMNNFIIDPIYEMIPEGSEAEELYCLPQDSRLQAAVSSTRQSSAPPARPKFVKSQEKLRSLCRSISSPMRMNEYLMSRVKRSNSNHSESNNQVVDVHTWLRTEGQPQNEGHERLHQPPLPEGIERTRQLNENGRSTRRENEPSLRLGSTNTSSGSTLSLVPPCAEQKQNNGGIVYTNLDNLERTIRLQQERLLREREEERLLRPRFSAPPPPSHPPPHHQPGAPLPQVALPSGHELATSFRGESSRDSHGTWEWKIKVRPDGSRYIARRPVRSLLLRERGKRIEEERGGNTTDDDALSEVKTGRFWTKDERKRQYEVARERRRRQEELIRAKTVSLRQQGSSSEKAKRLSYHQEEQSEPVLVATV